MSDIAVRIEGLGKKYRIGGKQRPRYNTLRDLISEAAQRPFRGLRSADRSETPPDRKSSEAVWALRDVTFDIHVGDVLGIIGRNGAGKSTLLKVLSRITSPTEGRAEIHGRVGSLLEVGTGFHPELTGRENIVLSGAILGMKQSEVLSKFDEIVAFADVEKFIDTPVKHYSSGMALRLGFAVAAHFEPEILMVDEVLAVGDIQFQKKCMGRLGQVARSGRTVLLVSHNLAAIAALCTRAVVISEGSVSFAGDVRTAVKQYLSENATMNRVSLEERSDREGDGRLRFDMVELIGESGKSTDTVQSGERVSFSLGYTSSDKDAIENTLFEIKVSDEVGSLLFALSTILTGENFNRLQPSGKVECRVPSLPLTPGKYSVQILAYVNNSLADWVRDATSFTVVEGNFFGTGRELRSDWYGQFLVPHNWISQS